MVSGEESASSAAVHKKSITDIGKIGRIMNRKIKKYRAIQAILIFYLLMILLLAGPIGVFDKNHLVQGTEKAVGQTAEFGREDGGVSQVFLAQGNYLKALYLNAVTDASKDVLQFTVYDEFGETLYQEQIAFESYEAPGFIRIPIEIETVPGRAYVWQISNLQGHMILAVENTAESGLTGIGNYYCQDQEFVGQNIITRYEYTESFSGKKMMVLTMAVLVLGVFLTVAMESHGRRMGGREVSFQWMFRRMGNPVLAAGALFLVYDVFLKNTFGGGWQDKLFYGLGIALFFGLLFYALNAKRPGYEPLFGVTLSYAKDHVMDWLQVLFFAGVLWGCIDYMNAMYDIYQQYAFRKTLFFFLLVLLTMCKKERIFRWFNGLWVLACGLLGYFVYWRPLADVAEQGELARLNVWVAMAAGLVAIQLVWLLVKKEIPVKKVSLPYAVLVGIFFLLLLVFRNTRGWPVYMVVTCVLLYLFYLAWENRDRFLANLCNGIILNFACAAVFCVLRRPFRAWFFYRYNFTFHTVTVTAYYLALVLAALLVKLLMQYHKSRKLRDWWATALLFAMAASFLIMTFSRTGYLAAAVMIAIVFLYESFAVYREKFRTFLTKAGVFVLLIVAGLPVTYSAVRLIPYYYNDPYVFDIEESEWEVRKGESPDSENYMTVPRFFYCMDGKLFGDASDVIKSVQNTMMSSSVRVEGSGEQLLVASTDYMPEWEEEEDFSNGRFDIFFAYIRQWNLTGHDQMGVELPNGEISVHAHNTYLQVFHDHGLITGVVYLLVGIVSLVLMFFYAKREEKRDAYAALPLAIFLAFAVAGLVEWLFHPCNPIGFATMAALTPLFYKTGSASRFIEQR